LINLLNFLIEKIKKSKILENFANSNGDPITQNEMNININVQNQKFKVNFKESYLIFSLIKEIKFELQ
jgi:hypothetical protein